MDTESNSTDWGSMSPKQYMKDRVDDQLAWYNKKSTTNKNWHFRLQLITLIAAALVPIISLSSPEWSMRILAALMGSIAAIAAGIVTLYQFRDLWTNYRTTAEQLKYEKYLFLTGSAPYNRDDCFPQFVNNVENIILQENHGWSENIKSQSVTPILPKESDFLDSKEQDDDG
jgi:hypothetical protein